MFIQFSIYSRKHNSSVEKNNTVSGCCDLTLCLNNFQNAHGQSGDDYSLFLETHLKLRKPRKQNPIKEINRGRLCIGFLSLSLIVLFLTRTNLLMRKVISVILCFFDIMTFCFQQWTNKYKMEASYFLSILNMPRNLKLFHWGQSPNACNSALGIMSVLQKWHNTGKSHGLEEKAMKQCSSALRTSWNC